MSWLDIKRGLWVSGVCRRYSVKQPGKQVTDPKSDSNALATGNEVLVDLA